MTYLKCQFEKFDFDKQILRDCLDNIEFAILSTIKNRTSNWTLNDTHKAKVFILENKHHIMSYVLSEAVQGQTDSQLQCFRGNHIIPRHFMWCGIKH